MKNIILIILFSVSYLFAQADTIVIKGQAPNNPDVNRLRLYGDISVGVPTPPLTLLDSVVIAPNATDSILYVTTDAGLYWFYWDCVDDTGNVSDISALDTTTSYGAGAAIDSTATLTPADFTDLTDVALSSYSISNGIALSAFDSAYAYAAGDSFKVGNVGALDVDYVRVFPDDTVFVSCVASGTNSTAEVKTLTIGGVDITYSVTTIAAAGYDTDAQALFTKAAALSADYTTNQKDTINQFILYLKDADSLNITNLSDFFDGFGFFMFDTTKSKLNWVYPDSVLTLIGTKNFVADSGFKGNGSDFYVNTNMVGTGMVNFADSSGAFGLFCMDELAEGGVPTMGNIEGGGTENVLRVQGPTAEILGKVNESNWLFSSAAASILGLTAISRRSHTDREIYFNGIGIGTDADDNSAFSVFAIPFTIFAQYYNGGTLGSLSSHRLIFWFISQGITDAQMSIINNCVKWYLTAEGVL